MIIKSFELLLFLKPITIFIFNILAEALKTPSNLSASLYFNSGSFLGSILSLQIITGLVMSLLFTPGEKNFFNLNSSGEEIKSFFFFHIFHANISSFFFMIIIFHIFRGFFFFSFIKSKLFFSGIIIFLMLMMISFFGYVLPWGQMSFWGSSVITNFLSILSIDLVIFLWGDFSPGDLLITFFFSLHFLFPFLLSVISLFHIILLHEIGSSSLLYSSSKKVNLSGFLLKDGNNLYIFIPFFFFIFLMYNTLGDSENYIESNKMVTPTHIKPEWYFLWAYAILRSVPSKLGGVSMLVMSIIFLLKLLFSKSTKLMKYMFLFFIMCLLTYLGGKPVETPYLEYSLMASIMYFLVILF